MKIKENLWVIIAVTGIAIVSRLIPHYPNFTALGGAAIFAGACFSRRVAILIPVLALFISDLILNNLLYASILPGEGGFVLFKPTSLWSYGTFIFIAVMASMTIRNRRMMPVIGTSVAGSVLFFLITNFAVWVHSGFYPKTIEGIFAAYTAGLPFLGNTVAGDLFFVAVFFGSLEAVRMFAPSALRKQIS